jgi:hypothetical protein
MPAGIPEYEPVVTSRLPNPAILIKERLVNFIVYILSFFCNEIYSKIDIPAFSY